EHKAYWAIKQLNLDAHLVGKARLLKLHELEEWRERAYENVVLFKARTKSQEEQGGGSDFTREFRMNFARGGILDQHGRPR
ncbi:hypothetical protein A2U01_0027413, partial [Trifolium medium]|nr:hypothetical protein [Trifolium medium]